MPKNKPGQLIAAEKRRAHEATERAHRVFRHWAENPGVSLREVGKQLKISHETVRKDLESVMQESAEAFADEVQAWRRKQLHRLESQLSTAWERYKDGDTDEGRLLKDLMKEINEIAGVRAAQKIEHTGKDGAPLPPTQIIITGVPGRDDHNE